MPNNLRLERRELRLERRETWAGRAWEDGFPDRNPALCPGLGRYKRKRHYTVKIAHYKERVVQIRIHSKTIYLKSMIRNEGQREQLKGITLCTIIVALPLIVTLQPRSSRHSLHHHRGCQWRQKLLQMTIELLQRRSMGEEE